MTIKKTSLRLPANIGKVTPILTNDPPPEKILRFDVVPKLYSTTFIVVNKESRKTNALWHILSNCTNKNMFVYIFSNTLFSDSNWEKILSELDKRKIGYFAKDDTTELPKIIHELSKLFKVEKAQKQAKKEGKDKSKHPFEKFVKVRKRVYSAHRKTALRYFFIFNDVSEELKTKIIHRFIKQH